MEKFLIVGNWKANLILPTDYRPPTTDLVEVAIAAPYPFISLIPSGFTRAAQNVSSFPTGPYTGEVPARVLASLKVKYCLVGHSERRRYLHENNSEVETKIKQAVENNIIPIICAQRHEEIPENIRNYSGDKFMIMYEPFEAISEGGQYHPESSERVMAVLTDWKNKLNLTCRCLYGGSVNPEDVGSYLTSEVRNVISGLVVGHASLNPNTFSDIIKKCSLG